MEKKAFLKAEKRPKKGKDFKNEKMKNKAF